MLFNLIMSLLTLVIVGVILLIFAYVVIRHWIDELRQQ